MLWYEMQSNLTMCIYFFAALVKPSTNHIPRREFTTDFRLFERNRGFRYKTIRSLRRWTWIPVRRWTQLVHRRCKLWVAIRHRTRLCPACVWSGRRLSNRKRKLDQWPANDVKRWSSISCQRFTCSSTEHLFYVGIISGCRLQYNKLTISRDNKSCTYAPLCRARTVFCP